MAKKRARRGETTMLCLSCFERLQERTEIIGKTKYSIIFCSQHGEKARFPQKVKQKEVQKTSAKGGK